MTVSKTQLGQVLAEALGDNPNSDPKLIMERRGTELWRASDRAGDEFAVKITTPCSDPQGHVDSERLALVEAELLRGLEAEGIVTGLYCGHGELPGSLGSWLTLRWLYGRTADTAFEDLRRKARDRDRLAANYAASMAGAVADLHDRGWRHGDLQEVHFMVSGSGVRLLDFAMTQRPGDIDSALVLYRGAYDYFMSPELAGMRLSTPKTQHLTVTPVSEVWSLCAVIYACWTGIYPISAKDTMQSTPELRAELAEGKVRDFAITRPWRFPAFEELVMSGLSVDPKGRPTARALQARFQELADSLHADV
ncbi:protein kinase domain-containing protein [Streptomyces sp. Midd1]|uniref:protein kinase domain-containing protein n=1 Tax=Streptomyces sp. Midd3 TaxID=3161191 RepID=UPI0034DB17BC